MIKKISIIAILWSVIVQSGNTGGCISSCIFFDYDDEPIEPIRPMPLEEEFVIENMFPNATQALAKGTICNMEKLAFNSTTVKRISGIEEYYYRAVLQYRNSEFPVIFKCCNKGSIAAELVAYKLACYLKFIPVMPVVKRLAIIDGVALEGVLIAEPPLLQLDKKNFHSFCSKKRNIVNSHEVKEQDLVKFLLFNYIAGIPEFNIENIAEYQDETKTFHGYFNCSSMQLDTVAKLNRGFMFQLYQDMDYESYDWNLPFPWNNRKKLFANDALGFNATSSMKLPVNILTKLAQESKTYEYVVYRNSLWLKVRDNWDTTKYLVSSLETNKFNLNPDLLKKLRNLQKPALLNKIFSDAVNTNMSQSTYISRFKHRTNEIVGIAWDD